MDKCFIRSSCEKLHAPVRTVSGIVDRQTNVPILSNILVEQEDQSVRFLTTDMDIQVRTSAPLGIEGMKNAFTVSSPKLNEVLGVLEGDQTVELSLSEESLSIRTENGSFLLQTLPAEDFPAIPQSDWPEAFGISVRTLKQLLTYTQFAMPSKDVRSYLNAVLVIFEKGKCICVSTDTHRLAYAENELTEGAPEGRIEMLLPRKTVRELLRLLPDSDETVSISVSSTQARFEFAGVEFVTKLVDGKFPDFTRVIPTLESNPCLLNINREALLRSLRRVNVMMGERLLGVRWKLTKDALTIQSNNNNQEESTQTIPVEWSGNELDLGFNIFYLLDVLGVLKTTDVSFHFAQNSRSVLVTMPESMKFRYVVMPMRI